MPKHPTGQQIANHLAEDLRETYLLAFDQFSVDPGDVVDGVANVTNTRYARELLGVLVNANLLCVTDVNGEQDVWQVIDPGTYDSNTREEAEATINAWLKQNDLNIAVAKTKETKVSSTDPAPAKTIEFRHCNCGCGENVPPKSWYRPGHDARHAGQVGRFIASNPGDNVVRKQALDALPSPALKAKAMSIAETAAKKHAAKAERAIARGDKPKPIERTAPYVEGKIKVARKAFPARKYEGGVIELNTNQDGTGDWIESDLTDAQRASFTEIVTEPIDTTQG